MNNKHSEEIQNKIEKRADKRSKKKRQKMKVSGSGVKQLQKLIINKAKRAFYNFVHYLELTPRRKKEIF